MPAVAAVPLQTQEAPLNETALQSLYDLAYQRQQHHHRLRERLLSATQALTEVACALNDRGQEEETKHTKKQARLQANDEEEDPGDLAKYDDFQTKVETLTQQMDRGIRSVIDTCTWLEELPEAVRQVSTKSRAISQAARRSTHRPTQDATQRSQNHDVEDGMEIDADDEPAQGPPDPTEAPTALLKAAKSTQETKWNSLSLTEKYAYNNDYVGFYKSVYDAKNPGEHAPPCPDAGFWFAAEEGRLSAMPQSQGGVGENEEDSDLEIAAERISIKCPLTLLPFTEPVTSKNCQHSYEKHAILDMLRTSEEHVPWTAEQLREIQRTPPRDRPRKERELWVPQVKCPECRAVLREADLRPNPVLLRKVNRIVEAQNKRDRPNDEWEEDDAAEDEAPVGTQRKPYGLGSSPISRARGRASVKGEIGASMIPQTQLSGGTQTAVRDDSMVIDVDDTDRDDDMTDELT